MVGAESGYTANHGGAGDPAVKEVIENRRIERIAMILLVFAHVDADFFCRAFGQHVSSVAPQCERSFLPVRPEPCHRPFPSRPRSVPRARSARYSEIRSAWRLHGTTSSSHIRKSKTWYSRR